MIGSLSVGTVDACRRAEWNAIAEAKSPAGQSFLAESTLETADVEVNVFDRDGFVGRSDDLAAGAADVRVIFVEARKANRIVVGHVVRHVLLTGELHVAVEATEVFDVEVLAVGQRVLRHQDQFVASGAARDLHQLGEVASAVDFIVEVEVDEIDQQLRALLTLEALRMPLSVLAQSFRFDVGRCDWLDATAAQKLDQLRLVDRQVSHVVD